MLFAIEIGTRRVQIDDVTMNPDSVWVTQQGRNLSFDFADQGRSLRFLIRDRDSKSHVAPMNGVTKPSRKRLTRRV